MRACSIVLALCALVVVPAESAAQETPDPLAAALEPLARCAFASHASESELRALRMHVVASPPRTVTVTFEGGDAALGRCATRAVRAALGRTIAAPLDSWRTPFASLELPMDPAPVAPLALTGLDPAQLAASAGSDPTSLVEQLERDRAGLPLSAASSLVAGASDPRAAAAQLCRVVVGAGALARLSRGLPAGDRTWLRAATRGRCGFPSVPRGAAAAPVTTCASDADCVIDCVRPPSCCGTSCGCGRAVTRSQAAADAAACAGHDRHACPEEACALGPQMVVSCRQGACVAAALDDMRTGPEPDDGPHGRVALDLSVPDQAASRAGEIRRAVLTHLTAVRACYDALLRRTPDVGGRMAWTVEIAPDGHWVFTGAESTLDVPSLASCIEARLGAVRTTPLEDGSPLGGFDLGLVMQPPD